MRYGADTKTDAHTDGRTTKGWFQCTELLLNEIYPSIKFQVNSPNTVWDMEQTRIKYEK